ncbi:MAG: sugar phosphate isomerase/epimerase family protein [Planctomycetota bacterium]
MMIRHTEINRRTALSRTLHAGLLATLSRPLQALSEQASGGTLPYMDSIGLQLYTLRGTLADDREGTLQAVADAGYRQVELMSIDQESLAIAAIARDLGMYVHSGFMDFNTITEPDKPGTLAVDETLELAQRIGLRHLVFGYIAKHQRDTADKCYAIAERANVAAERARAVGLRMCYHNHSFEFATLKTGKAGKSETTAFDIFTERFDPHQMEFELDVFWAKIGGHDPLAIMRKLAGRISQVHLKDLLAETPVIHDEGQVPKEAFEELGDGTIDIPAVMRLAKEIGVAQCHVEQDQSPDPVASIQRSATFLREQSA